ncbi:MAG TPA: RHS repeat-associated core domain-containing protein [Bellilinea sp.]|nr:RHS repeat-associated core domain-containing protein [Bellilinea sp.]
MRENGTLTWLLTDHLGSTSVTTDASGNLLSSLRYTAFGEVRAAGGTTTTDYRYTGQRIEAEIGLYYYVARFYDPALGRFISADSIVPGVGNPVAWDRYAYVNNNPIRYADPTGHAFLEPHGFSREKELSLVKFSDQGWGTEEKKTFERISRTVANAYAREATQNLLNQKRSGEIDGFRSANPESLFLEIHDGPVTFTRVAESCNGNGGGCAAETMSKNAITIYANASQNYFLNHSRVIAHELGHAFNNATNKLAQNVPSNLIRPMGENGVIDWGNIRSDFYGYADGFDDWQFGYSGHSGSEEFADMFVGWIYGTWGTTDMATDRSQFMTSHMSGFLGGW